MAMRIPTTEPNKLYTVEEFEQLPEFWERYELIDGRLVKKLANIIHGSIARKIMFAYNDFDRAMRIGEVAGADVNVKIEEHWDPAPDVSFWRASRRPLRVKGSAPYPDLCAEIWSGSDLRTKMNQTIARRKIARYLAAGVEIVWAINPDTKMVEVHRLDQQPQILGISDELDGENVIPGFKMAVKDLFE